MDIHELFDWLLFVLFAFVSLIPYYLTIPECNDENK